MSTRARWVVVAEDCGETFRWHTLAWDADDAMERFWGSLLGGPEGVNVLDVRLAPRGR